MNKDVIIIGGGPGGYTAAIRLAQLGQKVLLIENEELGGTCLNRGCIPTKALLHGTEYLNVSEKAKKYGIDISTNGYDLETLLKRKDTIVNQLVMGVNYLIKKNKIEFIQGHGKLIDKNTVEIKTPNEKIQKKGKNIIIATGSRPAIIKVPGYDNPSVITSDKALNMTRVPKRIAVIGAGAVGLEFANIYRNLGSEVTIVEMMKDILPETDEEVVKVLERELKKKGIKILKDTKLLSIDEGNKGLRVKVLRKDENLTIEKDQLLLATGRTPYIGGLNLDQVGVKTEKDRIVVNEYMETNISGIYAIGDVVGGTLLAHVASAEAIVAAKNCIGEKTKMDYKLVPGCIYTSPEVASIGLTEKQAREEGYSVKTGSFNLKANGKALAVDETAGMVKVIADEKYGEILGIHMIGDRSTDIIGEAGLAIKLEATVNELTSTIHAHPTMAEALLEATMDVFDMAIHK